MSVQEQDTAKLCFNMLSHIITTCCRHTLVEDASSQLGQDVISLIFNRHTPKNMFLDINMTQSLQGGTTEVTKSKRKRKGHSSSLSAVDMASNSGVFFSREIISLLLHSLKHCPSFGESSCFTFYVEKLFAVTKRLISLDCVYCDGIGTYSDILVYTYTILL